MPILEIVPLIESIRVSRVKGKTLFEILADAKENSVSLQSICQFFLNIVDQLLTEPEGVIPRELNDRELFSILSNFYLNADKTAPDVKDVKDFVLV
jgi:light-independent protochlorophyllide reductase subunit L